MLNNLQEDTQQPVTQAGVKPRSTYLFTATQTDGVACVFLITVLCKY